MGREGCVTRSFHQFCGGTHDQGIKPRIIERAKRWILTIKKRLPKWFLRERAHKFYYDRSDVYRSFIEMEQKAFAEGHLGKKSKELIAFGISICNNCESCMEWHLKQALDSGATREEIIEAIGVAIEMGGGMATVPARFAMNVLEYHSQA